MPQWRLANAIGVSVSTVRRWEYGICPMPFAHMTCFGMLLDLPIEDRLRLSSLLYSENKVNERIVVDDAGKLVRVFEDKP